jgi:hypothetical protein
MKSRFAKALMATGPCVAMTVLGLPSPAVAQFFFIIPIPRSSANPDTISATSDQRKLAMCAAFHEDVIDPDISGTRQGSWHGEVIHAAMQRLTDYPDAKKLIGAYMGQWNRQQKQNFEAGRAYGRTMAEGCSAANLPMLSVQYDYWKRLPADTSGAATSLAHIPAEPVKLDNLITSADFPAGFHPAKPVYATAVSLQIDAKGSVADCFVEETSGSEQIDDATCNLLKTRAQFRPAFEDGYLVVSEYRYRQKWPAPAP